MSISEQLRSQIGLVVSPDVERLDQSVRARPQELGAGDLDNGEQVDRHASITI